MNSPDGYIGDRGHGVGERQTMQDSLSSRRADYVADLAGDLDSIIAQLGRIPEVRQVILSDHMRAADEISSPIWTCWL